MRIQIRLRALSVFPGCCRNHRMQYETLEDRGLMAISHWNTTNRLDHLEAGATSR